MLRQQRSELYTVADNRYITLLTWSMILYGESCAVLRHNYPRVVTFLFSWNCPFKRLFSSQKYLYVCLIIYSPLKESQDFNKYVKTLRVKMAKRVRKTNKSPEDQQESVRPTRVRKTTKDKNKRHECPRTPARVRKSARVKEDCQVSRIQKLKSLEDWHNLRVKTQEDDSTIFPPTRGGDR